MTSDRLRHNVAVNLRRAIEDRGWSVAKLVNLSGVPNNTLYRMLRGENEPSVTHLATICEVLVVSMDRLVADPPELVQDSA